MIDFDDFEEQELKVSDVAEPEGTDEPLPEVPGFQPAGRKGGCGKGGKLRLLCFHGSQSNAALMARQMHVLFATHSGSQTNWLDALAEWECVDGPVQMPEFVELPLRPGMEDEEEEQPKMKRVLVEGLGVPRAWYEKLQRGSPRERWNGLQEAIDAAIGAVNARAPLDGLCGFGEGGELVCQLARLAEEGRPELQGAFKFVLTKAARWPKPDNGSDLLPRRPLTVPALHLCELSHSIYAPPDFEDMALRWDPDSREVVWLERDKPPQGSFQPGLPKPKRKPARLAGENLERARRFLVAFQKGERWRPQKVTGGGDPLAGLVLPLPRRREAVLTAPSPSRPVQLLCFHETDGTPGGGEMNHRIWEAVRKCALHTELSSCLDLEAVRLAEFISSPEDVIGDPPASAALPTHHAVSKHAVELAGKIAGKALEGSSLDLKRPVVLAGIGLGAYFALVCAERLRERGGQPWRLYAIKPAASFPAPAPGALGGCSVRCLLDPWDTSGERWRLALAAHGPFDVQILEHAHHCEAGAPLAYDSTGADAEGSLPWARALVDDLLSAFCWDVEEP